MLKAVIHSRKNVEKHALGFGLGHETECFVGFVPEVEVSLIPGLLFVLF